MTTINNDWQRTGLYAIFKQHIMLSKLLFVFVTLFNLTSVFGQEPIWTKQTKLSEALAFEKSLNPNAAPFSKNISTSKDYYPLLDEHQVGNPVIIQRDPLKYLPLSVEYYFTPDDSTLRFVSYEWEKDKYGNYFNKIPLWKEERTKFKSYNDEFERIKKNIITQFGIPISADTTAKIISGDRDKYYTREAVWQTDTLQFKLWMIFASNTYRIRLSTYWKNN